MLSALAVANHFLKLAADQGVTLAGYQLQALVYIAHGLRLGMVSEPLLDEPVFAGPEGISIAALNIAGALGERPMLQRLTEVIRLQNGLLDECIPVLASEEAAAITLDHVWQRFSHSSSEALRRLVCKTGSPWHSTWHSAERLLGSHAITLTHTWEPLPDSERPVAMANTTIRAWFRAAVIKDQKLRAAEEGLEQTARIRQLKPEHLRQADREWDASFTLTAV